MVWCLSLCRALSNFCKHFCTRWVLGVFSLRAFKKEKNKLWIFLSILKLYIPSTINTWKKLISTAVWAYEKCDSFWQIADQIKLRIRNNIGIYIDFNPEFSIQFRRRFYSKIEKWKKLTNDIILLVISLTNFSYSIWKKYFASKVTVAQ